MNHSKKMILIAAIISFATILSISYVHAQTITFSYSNATSTNPTQTFGSNETVNNSTLSTTPDPCVRSAELQIHLITYSFNITKATSLANANTEFKSRIMGYNSAFESNFNTWNLNKTSCTVTWKTNNLVYDLRNATSIVKKIVVTEDPATTTVLNVTEQDQIAYSSNAIPNSNWSGYEFAGDGSSSHTTKMYDSYSTFTVPSVFQPPYPSNACSNPTCNIVIWVGLEDKAGAADQILAQSGAQGIVSCNPTCVSSYNIWWEFLPNSLTICSPGITVHASDSITANEYMDTIVGGTDSRVVDTYIVDNTNPSAVCSFSHQYFNSTSPLYSSFIAEDLCLNISCSSQYTLPNFTSVQMNQNTVYYGNSYRYISQPYSNGWFNEYNYFNSADTSMNNHDPIGQNFTESWNSLCSPSSGTWTVSKTCTLGSNFQTSGNVIVQNGAVLRVPFGVSLKIDFSQHNLQVNSGGGVLIDGSSDPNNPTQPGGAVKCPTC
ncbi:MAG: hypothetical protein WBF38_06840 [Nitrosotalea sp.]